jgi:hypothetical protein
MSTLKTTNEKLRAWREHQFIREGLPYDVAMRWAKLSWFEVDTARVRELRAKGWTIEQIILYLEPEL